VRTNGEERLEEQAGAHDTQDDTARPRDRHRPTPRLDLGQHAGPHAQTVADEQSEQRGQRHHAEAPDLDENEDHHLAEGRPVLRGVDDHQACGAHHRGGSEEGGDDAGRHSTSRSHGQHEQHGPGGDGREEAADDDPDRVGERLPESRAGARQVAA
jgi:hypothetical protein